MILVAVACLVGGLSIPLQAQAITSPPAGWEIHFKAGDETLLGGYGHEVTITDGVNTLTYAFTTFEASVNDLGTERYLVQGQITLTSPPVSSGDDDDDGGEDDEGEDDDDEDYNPLLFHIQWEDGPFVESATREVTPLAGFRFLARELQALPDLTDRVKTGLQGLAGMDLPPEITAGIAPAILLISDPVAIKADTLFEDFFLFYPRIVLETEIVGPAHDLVCNDATVIEVSGGPTGVCRATAVGCAACYVIKQGPGPGTRSKKVSEACCDKEGKCLLEDKRDGGICRVKVIKGTPLPPPPGGEGPDPVS